ncbi:MAG: DUF4386 family protein [Chloroflexi bacterium]|nr:DUF4386 family protein [Chloroflexota bacterium]
MIESRELFLVRSGGAALILFLPMLLLGVILYGRIGMSSQSEGADALRRIADAGTSFPVMNALFHLGPLLLVPGTAALWTVLRGEGRDGWLLVAAAFAGLAVVVSAGVTFTLNQGLYRVAEGFSTASPERQALAASAAEMNLATQTGVELVQSLGIAFWLLAIAVAASAAGWPAWLVWLGVAGGIGFIAAGLSSVLFNVTLLSPMLAGLGGLGLLLFAIWMMATGVRLMTTAAT